MDIIRVVGRENPVKVYELINKKGDMQKIKREILELYEKGLKEYRHREWQKAMASFQKVLDKDPHDGPSLTYMKRCKIYEQEAPPKDWDGVYIMESK